jgi:hypothetical protein
MLGPKSLRLRLGGGGIIWFRVVGCPEGRRIVLVCLYFVFLDAHVDRETRFPPNYLEHGLCGGC